MGKTKRDHLSIYLDGDKSDLLSQLAANTCLPRTVLAREAIDDLLKKYGALKPPDPDP